MEFDRQSRTVHFIGVDFTEEDLSAHIEAIPENNNWERKKSEERVCPS